jgi:hypothetical protein
MFCVSYLSLLQGTYISALWPWRNLASVEKSRNRKKVEKGTQDTTKHRYSQCARLPQHFSTHIESAVSSSVMCGVETTDGNTIVVETATEEDIDREALPKEV